MLFAVDLLGHDPEVGGDPGGRHQHGPGVHHQRVGEVARTLSDSSNNAGFGTHGNSALPTTGLPGPGKPKIGPTGNTDFTSALSRPRLGDAEGSQRHVHLRPVEHAHHPVPGAVRHHRAPLAVRRPHLGMRHGHRVNSRGEEHFFNNI